ncbi:phage tail assembly protein [Saccharopolyspora pogona]|uniref:phage tail assembly protein n=1 Tax=Saccharopolyspora pogona TaxID=333966 RepID=UPI00168A1BE7|nr:phage tail assembly protein [Saccharopolyspora pogona]
MTDNVFTLDDLDAAIEREYAPLTFQAAGEEFVLRSLLRVEKKRRDAVIAKLKELDDAGDDIDEDLALSTVQFILKSVTADDRGTKLLKALGDDLLRFMRLLSMWSEATQPGEATASPN